MAFDLQAVMLDFLNQQRLLVGQPHFVVAYSGGRDSSALLEALYQVKKEHCPAMQITAAYYWHAWRDVEKDFEVIHHNCDPKKIPWVILTPNLNLAKTETAARDDRYEQLGQLALSLGATAILTGHHMEDDVETLLFRLFRGTGLNGLQGIPEIRTHEMHNGSVLIARPFLSVPNNELMRYVKIQKQQFVDDPTNQDTKHARNLIRHNVIPVLAEAFPNFRQSLVQVAEEAQLQSKLSQLAIHAYWKRLYDEASNSLDYVTLLQLSPQLRDVILRQYLLRNEVACNHQRLKHINQFLDGSDRKFRDSALYSLGKTQFLALYKGKIAIQTQEEKPMLFEVPLRLSTQVSIPVLGMQLTIREIPIEDRPQYRGYKTLSANEAYLDMSKFVDKPLVLRLRQDGDRIVPLGMKEPTKLKRLLNNRSIPRLKRDQLPVIAHGDNVLWVLGVEISELVKVKGNPTHHLVFTPLERLSDPAQDASTTPQFAALSS